MITDMRDSISSWPVRIILTILIFTFIISYGWNSGKGELRSGEIANVNGDPIKAQDFAFQYQSIVQSYQKQGRLSPDMPESIMNLLKQQLLSSMIYQKLKAAEAKKVGLVASDEKVTEVIKKQFSSETSPFDFKFYEDFLRNQMGKTTGQYREDQRKNIRAELFEKLILETGLSSNLELKESYKKNNEKVSLTYVKLNPKSTAGSRPALKPATAAELEAYYKDHQEEFKTKEKRKLDIAYFDKDSFDKIENFSKTAEQVLQDYTTKYQDFAEAAAKDSRLHRLTTPLIDYNDYVAPFSQSELTEILNSTQNLEVGKSTILVSRDGNKVFLTKLVEFQDAKLPEFASIRSQVEKSFAASREQEEFDSWMEQSWKNISSGALSLEAFAKKTKSPIKDTESFANNGGNLVPGIGDSEEAIKQAFTASKEKPYFTKPIKVGDDYYLIKLKNKTELDWKKFETEQENLANVLHQQSAQSRFAAWMGNIEKHSKIKRELNTGGNPFQGEE